MSWQMVSGVKFMNVEEELGFSLEKKIHPRLKLFTKYNFFFNFLKKDLIQ
jgi:hypothetical protein